MKTYLVTGGAGFIGSNFIHYLLKRYQEIRVINFDLLTYAGNLSNLKDIENDPRYQFVQGDIGDAKTVEHVFVENNIDYVVNFAAESHVDRSIEDAVIFFKTNVLGTVNLLSQAKHFWQKEDGFIEGKKFLQISTDEVYGSLGAEGYFKEDTPLDPHSPYAASKAGADLAVQSYFDTYHMPINITRCSNNYGPYQFPEKLIPLIIYRCMHKKEIPVYGDGLNVRDWLYVEDHCRAVDAVIHQGRVGQVYNIGGNYEHTNQVIVETVIQYFQEHLDSQVTKELIQYVKDRKGHDRRYAIDASKIRSELGWKPLMSFEEGITKTIQWVLAHVDWLRSVTSGEYQAYYQKMYGA